MSNLAVKFKKLLMILNVKSTYAKGVLSFHMKHAASEYNHFKDNEPQTVFNGQNPKLIESWYNLLVKYCWDKVKIIFKAEFPELVPIATNYGLDFKNLIFCIENKFRSLKVYTFNDLIKRNYERRNF